LPRMNSLSSLYAESSSSDVVELPVYKEGHCPDTLAWSDEFDTCSIRCIFPVFSEDETQALFIVDGVLACIGFLLCYFYCITTLFRPVMQQFPNSNIFFMHFSMMIVMVSIIIPFFLGPRYVFCDTNTTPGQYNWACVLCGSKILPTDL